MRSIVNRRYHDDGVTVWNMFRVVATDCGDRLIGITSTYSDVMIRDTLINGRKIAAAKLHRARRDLNTMAHNERRKYVGL